MTSLMMFLVCIAGFLPVATAYTYTFIMSVVSVSEGQNGIGPVIRDIRLDGVRPTEDQFNINKMPDRDLCQAHNGATCDAGQIGMIDDDPNTDSNWVATNGAGQEFFSITSPTRVSTIEIASQSAFYTPGWIIEEDGVEMYRDVANRGSVHGSSRSFTYNLAQTTTGVEYLQRAKLTADDGAAEDWFSRYVSIDGDTMVVGAPKDGGQGPGSAYVFTRVTAGDLASSWTQVAKLTADDGAASDWFGNSVSIDGDTVVVGANDDDDKGSSSGSAYVFTRLTAGDLASDWTQVAKLTAGDGAAMDRFARALSFDGDTVVIGAYGDDSLSGSAYVFSRVTAGDLASGWRQVAKLTADDRAASDQFSVSVSIDGDTVVIGAHYDDDKGDKSGSAYVYTRDTAGDLASNWTQIAKLTADDGAVNDNFGYSVSIDGDTMVVGAHYDDDKGSNSGSAYVFTRTTAGDLASGWTQHAKLTADDGAADDWFGRSVSIDGDTMVIGATQDDDKESNSGSAYVFMRVTAGDLASGWTQVAKLTAADGVAGDEFGNSVMIDGDTVVIGAYQDDDDVKGDNSGSAYVFTLACSDGYRGARCETAMPCVASTNSSKDGGDGDFHCVNGGTIGGTTGSCTCTSCDTAYGGASCHIGPCDMEQSCYDFNVRNGMTTPATCAWMAFEAPGCDAKCGACGDCDYELTTGDIKGWGASEAGGSTGNVASARDCAKLCSENDNCLSYEYSRTSKICNRNTEADPTVKNNYRDYLFCSNKAASEA